MKSSFLDPNKVMDDEKNPVFVGQLRINLVINSLELGGAQRNVVAMANSWADQGAEITLTTLDDASEHPFKLHPGVDRVELRLPRPTNTARGLMGIADRIRRLREVISVSRPSIVISSEHITNVLTLLSAGTKTPVVVTELIDAGRYPLPLAWRILRRLTYRRADALVVVSSGMRDWAERVCDPARVHVIPRSLSIKAGVVGERSRELVALGRLAHQKGFDLLLQAFAQLAERHPDLRLTIYGEGEERHRLEQLIAKHGLGGRVSLPGIAMDPVEAFRGADVFAFPSRYEGFGNVLVEALASGLPVVATDCPSGPRDIVRPGIDGILVPPEDVEALTRVIDELMSDDDLRDRLAARAPEVTERFGPDKIMGRWNTLVENVLS